MDDLTPTLQTTLDCLLGAMVTCAPAAAAASATAQSAVQVVSPMRHEHLTGSLLEAYLGQDAADWVIAQAGPGVFAGLRRHE